MINVNVFVALAKRMKRGLVKGYATRARFYHDIVVMPSSTMDINDCDEIVEVNISNLDDIVAIVETHHRQWHRHDIVVTSCSCSVGLKLETCNG